MRWFALSLMAFCAVIAGCEAPKEKIEAGNVPKVTTPSPTVNSASSAVTVEGDAPAAVETTAPPAPAAGTPADPKASSTSTTGGDAVRFVATQSVKVPTMMCPYSCWPKVKETLAAQPGVEGVQLAAQEKATEIDNPVVELKTTEGFNAEAAIAALEKINFANAVVIK